MDIAVFSSKHELQFQCSAHIAGEETLCSVQRDGQLTSPIDILFLFPRVARAVRMCLFSQFGDG